MTAKPYHVLDSGKVRCHMCGKLLRWLDAVETEIGYACEDHILQEDDEPVDAPDPILAWLEREAAEARERFPFAVECKAQERIIVGKTSPRG